MNEQETPRKKLYQKWWIWVIGLILVVFVWNKTSSFIDDVMTKEIPNVMGINYTDAEKVLKDKGFKVISVETDAESILSGDYNNRDVKKGDVFKVNNETNPKYTYAKTKDKQVTVYYAKDNYPAEKTKQQTELQSAESKEPEASGSPETWKQFLKDYEEWTDKYIEFAKKCKSNPNDTKLIAEYAKLAAETVEWTDKAEKYEEELRDDNVSAEVITEYINTLARITQKIANAAQ